MTASLFVCTEGGHVAYTCNLGHCWRCYGGRPVRVSDPTLLACYRLGGEAVLIQLVREAHRVRGRL